MLAPFLPHSAQRVHEAFGRTGVFAPMPRIEEVEDLDGGPGYPVITGDYSAVRPWRRREVVVGTPVSKPTPVFTKLDPSLVEDELARVGAPVAPHGDGFATPDELRSALAEAAPAAAYEVRGSSVGLGVPPLHGQYCEPIAHGVRAGRAVDADDDGRVSVGCGHVDLQGRVRSCGRCRWSVA